MQLILLILRIIICIIVIQQAKKKNRSSVGWGIFAFILPLVAWIWISSLKVNMEWTESE